MTSRGLPGEPPPWQPFAPCIPPQVFTTTRKTAQLCPVCKGKGKLATGRIGPEMRKCHGCSGKGWVVA